MQSAGYDECYPHAEVVDLYNDVVGYVFQRKKKKKDDVPPEA
jgi:hypothetical protein